MYKIAVTYKDFDNNERTEDLYFNLTEAEAVRLELRYPGGIQAYVASIDSDTNAGDIMDMFETVLSSAYGEKSKDGRHFHKTPEIRQDFLNSAAYSNLFVRMMRDTDFAAEVFNGILSRTTLDNDPIV